MAKNPPKRASFNARSFRVVSRLSPDGDCLTSWSVLFGTEKAPFLELTSADGYTLNDAVSSACLWSLGGPLPRSRQCVFPL